VGSDLERLARNIHSAFAAWPYPGDEKVLREDACGGIQCDEIRRNIVGKHWNALKVGDVAYKDSLELYLTAAGYRYYLPGLMKVSIENPEIYDLPAYIAQALTPSTKDQRPRGNWLEDYKAAFTDEQQQVIRDFLVWVNTRFEGGNWWEAAGRALSAVWGSPGPDSPNEAKR
jgi:hypothetical protein